MKLFSLFLVMMAMQLAGPGSLRAQNAEASDPASDIKLSPSDKLSFSIEEDPGKRAPTPEVMVSPLGELTLPVSQGFETSITINVKDKTLADVRKEIKARLEESYYKKATVQLRLKDVTTRTGKVYFSGQVKSPTLNLPGTDPRKLYDALVEVGLSEYANLKKVKVTRTNPKTGQKESTVYDMKKVKDGAKDAVDPVLQDGDRVDVPEKGLNLF